MPQGAFLVDERAQGSAKALTNIGVIVAHLPR